MKKEDFVTDKWDSYGKSQYRSYLKLTSDQKQRIESLKEKIGEKVQFRIGKKFHIMKIMWVSLTKNDKSPCKNYMSYPYQFRLNYTDNKFREHDGFWSTKIDNLSILRDN